MPIDASSDPYDVSGGSDPAGAKAGALGFGRLGDADDDEGDEEVADAVTKTGGVLDDELDAAGTGARGVDLAGIDKGASALDDDLDAAGTGAKFDPALGDDDDGDLDELDLDSPLKSFDVGDVDDGDLGALKSGFGDLDDDDLDDDGIADDVGDADDGADVDDDGGIFDLH